VSRWLVSHPTDLPPGRRPPAPHTRPRARVAVEIVHGRVVTGLVLGAAAPSVHLDVWERQPPRPEDHTFEQLRFHLLQPWQSLESASQRRDNSVRRQRGYVPGERRPREVRRHMREREYVCRLPRPCRSQKVIVASLERRTFQRDSPRRSPSRTSTRPICARAQSSKATTRGCYWSTAGF